MKKRIVVLILLIMLLLGCEKKEYNLILISGNELNENFLNSSEPLSFVLAFYNKDASNSEEFLKDLEKVAKRTKEDIYYIDTDMLTGLSYDIIEGTMDTDISLLRYVAVDNNTFVVDEIYTDYDKLYKDLNGKNYKYSLKLEDDQQLKEYYNQALDEFDAGNYGMSLGHLKLAVRLPEAREFRYKHDIYDMIGNIYKVRMGGTKKNTVRYIYLGFGELSNTLTYFETEVKSDKFDESNFSIEEFPVYYYKIENNQLLIRKEADSKYKKLYDIEYISKNYLALYDDSGLLNFYNK